MQICLMDFPSHPVGYPLADVVERQWDPIILLLAKLAVLMAIVGLNGFFVAAEFAFVKVRGSQLKRWKVKAISGLRC